MPTALTVDSISKQFRLHRNRPVTLKEALVRRLNGQIEPPRDHWVLRDVSFKLGRGRALGIIGHNGAGKSTLLRLLCGLGRPNSGTIKVAGQISGLLDLGSGFHADMTGRENIMTGGLLTGFTRREIQAQQDEIITFAELEEAIDQPVRTYSSGMYVRLAFATAMQFDPDIMVIDEVLMVGDSRFQQKCLKRMDAFRAAGKTLILTSHVPDQIRSLCDEVLVLEDGQVAMHGDPDSAMRHYDDLMRQRTERRAADLSGYAATNLPELSHGNRQGTQEASITMVALSNDRRAPANRILPGEGLHVDLEYTLAQPLNDMIVSLTIINEEHVKCFESIIPSLSAAFGPLADQGSLGCYLPELPLLPGRYYVNIGLYPVGWGYIYDYHWQMHTLDIGDLDRPRSNVSGVVSLQPIWSTPAHWGQ
ncbi:MAG TPA: ABC transporter ATP-binding protein [Roseiflexaceae bacterium]|nr:ABC transporter ATP-binding protein [Roseiflexaceae bacterium]